MVQLLQKTVWRFLKRINIELPQDPGIPLLGIHPKELKAGSSRGICTPMYTASLFPVVKR